MCLEERLTTEARECGEAQRCFDARDVHVGKTILHKERTRTHLFVCDARQRDLIAIEPDCGVEASEWATKIFVEPPIDWFTRVTRVTRNCSELAADEGHLLDGRPHDARCLGEKLLGHTIGPDGRWLDDVVIDRDDLWKLAHVRHCITGF